MWTLFGMTPKMRKNPSCAKLKRKLQENKTPLSPPHTKKNHPSSLIIKYFNFFFLSLSLEILAFFGIFKPADTIGLPFPPKHQEKQLTKWSSSPSTPSQQFGKETATKTTTTTNFLISIHSVEKSSNTNFCTTSFSPWYKKKSWQSFEKHFWKISRKVSYYDILILSFSRENIATNPHKNVWKTRILKQPSFCILSFFF